MNVIYKNKQSKLKEITLLLILFFLILLGNKEFLVNIKEELQERDKIKQQRNLNPMKEHKFETQELIYDNKIGQLKNPSLYFQSVMINRFDFTVNKKKIENGNNTENASESN